MKKKILSLVVVMAMLLSFMPVIAQAETSGECGDNLTWTLDDNGTLTISGEGTMKDWISYSYAPWDSSSSSIKNVIIGNSVESIGDHAFGYCSSLESVTIGNSVESIGDYAFWKCSGLKSVTIGNSVESIGERAFGYCSSLESVIIPDSVTSIGDCAFYKCSSLTSVVIPDSVESIGWNAFGYCSSLTSVIIGNGVTSIGDSAFYECSSLESVTIGNSVTSIGDEAFRSCSSLESVVIPDSVISIGAGAFRSCSSLESVTIPDSVTSIGDRAFSGCSRLTDVYYRGSEEQWNAIGMGIENGCLTNATIHYNSTDYQTQILDYSEIDGKCMIKSTAKNNTDTAISCVMYSAVYSSDGTLKACGTVKADIDADNDKEVDISVPCTIETGDTLKTFMWADNMTPFAKAGELVIE